MIKDIMRIALVFIAIGCSLQHSVGQVKLDTITLKKGEVLDILLLSQNPETEDDLKTYFQVAFPVAKKMSYQPLPGFRIAQNNSGNIRPDVLILGKWDNVEIREDFLSQIVEEVEDFHERRRKIWSYFGLRYFEIQEDLSMVINRDHVHVATAHWSDSKSRSSEFHEQWAQAVRNSGGKILLQLKEGKSPFGYRYDPDYFTISTWKNEAAFSDFQEKIKKLGWDNIQHVNEFILE